MAKENWFEHNAKKVLTIIVALFVVICDIFSGAFFLEKTEGVRNIYYHHDLKKNFSGQVKWGHDIHPFSTNSFGFKDKENRKIPLHPDKFRCVLIGDSFSEGVGYDFPDTFAGITDRKSNGKFEFLNAAVKSYSPKLYYLKIKHLLEVQGLKFDHLFAFIDISDIQDEIVYESFIPAPPHSPASFLYNIDIYLKSHSFLYKKIINNNVFRLLDKFIASHRTEDAEDEASVPLMLSMKSFFENYANERPKWTSDIAIYEKWGQRGVQLAQSHMARLVKLCNKHRIGVTIAVYPWPFQIKNKELNSRQVELWRKFADQEGVHFLNYFPGFINSNSPEKIIKTFFIPGDVHWNEKGHEFIADLLWRHLSSLNIPGA